MLNIPICYKTKMPLSLSYRPVCKGRINCWSINFHKHNMDLTSNQGLRFNTQRSTEPFCDIDHKSPRTIMEQKLCQEAYITVIVQVHIPPENFSQKNQPVSVSIFRLLYKGQGCVKRTKWLRWCLWKTLEHNLSMHAAHDTEIMAIVLY